MLVVDRRSDPLTRPSLEELPHDGGIAALVEQRVYAVEALDLPFDSLLAPLPEILALGKASLENDVNVFL
jgi:hypothetical protein